MSDSDDGSNYAPASPNPMDEEEFPGSPDSPNDSLNIGPSSPDNPAEVDYDDESNDNKAESISPESPPPEDPQESDDEVSQQSQESRKSISDDAEGSNFERHEIRSESEPENEIETADNEENNNDNEQDNEDRDEGNRDEADRDEGDRDEGYPDGEDRDEDNDNDGDNANNDVDDDDDDDDAPTKNKKRKLKIDSDDEDEKPEKKDLVADIFGDSDDEEFEGFNREDIVSPKKKERKLHVDESEGESDEKAEPSEKSAQDEESQEQAAGDGTGDHGLPELSDDELESEQIGGRQGSDFVSDFELMMERRKQEQRHRRRKRRDVDIINDNDDLISMLIEEMRNSAEEDRQYNGQKKAATKKLKLLSRVMIELNKADLQPALLESGILSAMTDWLAPLPDKSLPHLQIREGFISVLSQFGAISPDLLKSSGIGKAVMYLFKHPKEIKKNKEKLGKLINEWSRPIFQLQTNYSSLTREEREERDLEKLPAQRRASTENDQAGNSLLQNEQNQGLRPGDPGWCSRARVPTPSNKDYLIRPKSRVEGGFSNKSSSRKGPSRLEKHMRNFAEKKKLTKTQRAVSISIEGRKLLP